MRRETTRSAAAKIRKKASPRTARQPLSAQASALRSRLRPCCSTILHGDRAKMYRRGSLVNPRVVGQEVVFQHRLAVEHNGRESNLL